MSYTVVYRPEPPHVCDKPAYASHGTIIQCECGQYWRYVIGTKTNYSGWDLATESTVDSARKGLLA